MINKNCNSCESCNSCNSCKNLVHGFRCINLKLKEKDLNKYWIFNKEVSKEEWDNRFNIGESKLCDKCGQELRK